MNLRTIVTLTLLLACPTCIYAQSIQYSGTYKLIDSLSQDDTSRLVFLDIKSKKFNFEIQNKTRVFIQENSLDTTQGFIRQSLFYRMVNEYIVLNILELKRVESDSIYVSATFQKFNEKGNVGKPKKINNLSVNKSELLGVMISPPLQEINKAEKTLSWLTVTLGIAIATVLLISN
jgi:hypothetical protein